jgi:hypothetical protein
VLFGFLAAGCSGGSDVPDEELTSDLAPPPAEAGVVLETLMSSGYSYARVAAGTEEIWVAGPGNNALAAGDTVVLLGAENMGVFRSDALDRTFQDLYFVGSWAASNPNVQVFQGTVTETMNSAGYTYVQVEVPEELRWLTPGGEESEDLLVWLAGPESTVSVGDQVQWQGGSVMREFRANSLDRTFQEIVFVGGFEILQ